MAADGLQMTSSRHLLARIPIRHWAIWRSPKRALIGYVLAIDVVALVGIVATSVVVPVGRVDIVTLILLIGCSVLYTELSLPIERMQQRYQGAPAIDLNSVWMFAAVL